MFGSQTAQFPVPLVQFPSLLTPSFLFPHVVIPNEVRDLLFFTSIWCLSQRAALTPSRQFPRVHISIIPRHLRFLCFHTVTHSFVAADEVSPVFSIFSKLFAQNTGVGYTARVEQQFQHAL